MRYEPKKGLLVSLLQGKKTQKRGLLASLLQRFGEPLSEAIETARAEAAERAKDFEGGLASGLIERFVRPEEDPEQETRDFQLENILNEGIEFGDNIRGGFFEIETNGQTQRLIHNLGYTPTGFLVVSREGEVSVWSEDLTAWTKDVLFFKSNVANLKVRIFVL